MVAGQDVAQEVEKWAELAALDSVAHSAHFPVSCVTSSNSTSVQLRFEPSSFFSGSKLEFYLLSFLSPLILLLLLLFWLFYEMKYKRYMI